MTPTLLLLLLTATGREEPLWDGPLVPQHSVTGPQSTREAKPVAGKGVTLRTNVSSPTLTWFEPEGDSTGAVLVLPGGGYRSVAIDLEGTEVCEWLASTGLTCVVLTYRVPKTGPHWEPTLGREVVPETFVALLDAQRAMTVLRERVGGKSVGVMGFSAGGHLAAALSTAETETRPDFAVLVYPGHLWKRTLVASIQPSTLTPQTLLVHAVDDAVDDVRHSVVYARALRDAGAPVELRVFATGGHAFGVRNTGHTSDRWREVTHRWLSGADTMAEPKLESFTALAPGDRVWAELTVSQGALSLTKWPTMPRHHATHVQLLNARAFSKLELRNGETVRAVLTLESKTLQSLAATQQVRGSYGFHIESVTLAAR